MIRAIQKFLSPDKFCGCIGASRVRLDGRCNACGRISDVPRDWRNVMNAAIEDTTIKAKKMQRPTVDQVEVALHVFDERKRNLSEKGAMRVALQAAFNKF